MKEKHILIFLDDESEKNSGQDGVSRFSVAGGIATKRAPVIEKVT